MSSPKYGAPFILDESTENMIFTNDKRKPNASSRFFVPNLPSPPPFYPPSITRNGSVPVPGYVLSPKANKSPNNFVPMSKVYTRTPSPKPARHITTSSNHVVPTSPTLTDVPNNNASSQNSPKTFSSRSRNICSPLLDEPGFVESAPMNRPRQYARLLIARASSKDDLNESDYDDSEDMYKYKKLRLFSGIVITVGLMLIGLEMFLVRR